MHPPSINGRVKFSPDFIRHLKMELKRGKLEHATLRGCSTQGARLGGCCRALREGPEWDTLSEARRRIVESELRDFVLGGVALEV